MALPPTPARVSTIATVAIILGVILALAAFIVPIWIAPLAPFMWVPFVLGVLMVLGALGALGMGRYVLAAILGVFGTVLIIGAYTFMAGWFSGGKIGIGNDNGDKTSSLHEGYADPDDGCMWEWVESKAQYVKTSKGCNSTKRGSDNPSNPDNGDKGNTPPSDCTSQFLLDGKETMPQTYDDTFAAFTNGYFLTNKPAPYKKGPELDKVTKTWVNYEIHTCNTTVVAVFAREVKLDGKHYKGGAWLYLAGGDFELDVLDGEVIAWATVEDMERYMLEYVTRVNDELENGNLTFPNQKLARRYISEQFVDTINEVNGDLLKDDSIQIVDLTK